ncbi:MAG: Leucyl-tRNA synthetase [uncultured Truepera sp.]|uniref:Leucine--tRNA ligase n=1 Tax=uncultured Truepera sp. TaxID=543023 RepID=A0A6J4V4Q1_9DEIN|nr:MAG: Leucyl-tRNA synthetase [uncultured Truepera sp.]
MTTNAKPAAPYRSDRYNPQEIEPKWQQAWADVGLYETDLTSDREPFYYLTMYPYPSGDLHIGHWYAFAVPDAYARFKRMHGLNVFFPMGFDAFGLPAENAAIKAAREGKNVHPATLTYERMAHMERQFARMGTSLDWSKKVVTSDPEYYRWNQFFFLKMFERGLAYRKESFVNWDPVDQTVLANEQVVNGRGDRSGALIERRLMPQWHFKITDYADELLDFSRLDWPEKVKLMQTNWIGRSEGAEVTFRSEEGDFVIFTTRPDTLWGVSFMVLAPEHPLVEKLTTPERKEAVEAYVKAASHLSEIERGSTDKEKTGEFTGSYAVNPVNGARVPIWVADYVMMGYGTGAIMAVPAHDERDFEFARKFGLEIIPVISETPDTVPTDRGMTEAYTGDGFMVNSGPFDGTPTGKGTPEGIEKVTAWLGAESLGKGTVTYRLRDWLISRQRAWGTPIPFLYCDSCGLVPEREENLPVVLPTDVAFMPTGESPLKYHAAFLTATCPECGGPAQRETDTMDTFVDSSWYWFRFLSPHKDDGPFDPGLASKWTPAQQYTGGVEHAILHLLYARFFTKVIRDLGLITSDEPFTRLRNQGMILGEDNEKMSKSRGNVVNPDDLVAEYGADTVRAYLMFIGPWEAGGPWSSTGIEGVARFLNRVWALVTEPGTETLERATPTNRVSEKALRRAVHHAVKEVSDDLAELRFNTAIAELMTLTNAMGKAKPEQAATETWLEGIEKLLLLLAPIAPHIADELWERSGHADSVHQQAWPEYDAAALEQDTVIIAVQVGGKRRGEVTVPKDADKDAVLAAAKAEPNVARHVEGKQIVREIVVPGRLVNIVVKG